METLARARRALFVDATSVGRGSIASGLDCYIVLNSARLHETILPDGFPESDKDSIWNADSLEVEKEVYQRLHGIKSLAIVPRNILLTDDWTIRAIDFANSTA